MDLKIIGVIPARYKSSRLKEKLLLKVFNKPLLQYTFENAQKLSCLDGLYVATDHEKIGSLIKSLKGGVIMTPHCENGTTRIAKAVKKNPKLQKSDIIVNLQGDHPFVSSETIKKIIEKLKEDKTAHVATAVSLIDYERALSPNNVKCVFDKNHNALYFSRAPIPFRKSNDDTNFYYHVGVYAYRTDFLLKYPYLEDTKMQVLEDLEQLKILEHGYKIKVAIVEENPLSIDTQEDIKKMEDYLCQLNTSL